MDDAVKRLLSRRRPQESYQEFARRIGVSQQIVSNWQLGKAQLSRQKAEVICDNTGWSLDWLLMGRSPDEDDAFWQGVVEEHVPSSHRATRYVTRAAPPILSKSFGPSVSRS